MRAVSGKSDQQGFLKDVEFPLIDKMQTSDPTKTGLNTENDFWWFFKLIYPFNERFKSTSIRVLSLLTTSFIFYFVFYKLCHNVFVCQT